MDHIRFPGLRSLTIRRDVMKKIMILFLSLLLCTSLLAQSVSKVGTTAANFLNIDVGARAVSMGGAFTTLANDASAVYWNPAGLARMDRPEAMFNHTQWLADIRFNFAALVIPMQQMGTIGLSATFLTMDEMEVTTTSSPMGNGELFSAGSYAFALSYAHTLTDRFSIGGSVKYVRENIYHCSANGFALDVGTLFETQFNGLMIGMSISNYGTKMRMSGLDLLVPADYDPSIEGNNDALNAYFQTDGFDMPLMFRVGLGMDVLKGAGNSNLFLAVDALHPNDDVESLNVGAEYLFNNMVALRAGYRSLFGSDDSEEGLTLGGGVNYRVVGFTEIRLSYAYQDFGILNNVQRVSVGLAF